MGLTLEGWVWDQKYGTYTIKSFDDLSSPLHSGRGVVNERGEIIGIVKADDSYNKSMYIIPIDVISEKEGFAIVKGDLCFKKSHKFFIASKKILAFKGYHVQRLPHKYPTTDQ